MSGIIWMQAIVLSALEEFGSFVTKWEKTRDGVEVDDWHCPDVSCFLDGIDIFIEEESTHVLVVLVRLDILVVRVEDGTMDRCHQHDLLVGIHLLEL